MDAFDPELVEVQRKNRGLRSGRPWTGSRFGGVRCVRDRIQV